MEEDTLPGGYVVKRDEEMFYSAYVMHRLPELWPEAEVFNPDRFIDTPKPYTFVPFHGGPRLCLGMDMAYLEARVCVRLCVSVCVSVCLRVSRCVSVDVWMWMCGCVDVWMCGCVHCLRRPHEQLVEAVGLLPVGCGGVMVGGGVTSLQVALCVLLRRFRFKVHPGHVVMPKVKIILTALNGMVMDVEDRV